MIKILITGANGQLGNELQRILSDGYAEIGPIPEIYDNAEVICGDVPDMDITDLRQMEEFAESCPCDIIVNCAAITNVDGCETDYDTAYRVNAIGAKNLAKIANQMGAKLVHVSTDYVFAGDDPRPRREDDPTGPVSAYGRTKLEGERFALEECERTFVMRTAWLYGYVGKNFVRTMMRLGESRDQVTVVSDQLGNPTSANDLAYEIMKVAATENYGIYHCTNEGTCSWAAFAAAIMELAGLSCRVVPCSTQEYRRMNPDSAQRPAYSSLENTHLQATVGNEMRPWREALESFFRNMNTMGE